MRPLPGSRFWAMAHKEVLHMMRDFRVIYLALGLPVVLIFIYGYAVSFDLDHIPIAVVDQDGTEASRALAERFASSDLFDVVVHSRRANDVTAMFRSGVVKAALVVPRGYARRLNRSDRAQVGFVVDGSDNTTASQSLGYAAAVAARHQAEMAQGMADVPVGVDARVRVLFNPDLKSAHYLVPGLIVLVMSMLAVMMTALTVAREWEWGSMELLFTTPAGSFSIILGKLAPYFVMGLLQVLLVVTAGAWLFDVPLRGSMGLLMLSSSVFLFALLGQGVLISVVTRNQMLATLAAALSTFLPALLLSDFIFPIDNMPKILQWLAQLLPSLYYVHSLRAIMLRGSGWDMVGPALVPMAAFFLFVLAAALTAFKRRLS
ncbi:MAG: ABC transporter permease [Deltaproteobacteria bacterium]|nr:ABC transporter permease [Deltaproteobacteria bacterium]